MVEGLQQEYDIKEIPFNIELEKEVLGIIFLDDRLMEDVVDTVKRDVFYFEFHKEIWTAMMYLYHNNVGIGIETVVNRLQAKECSDELLEYTFTITQPSTHSFKNKVDLLLDIYYKRAIYTICLDIVQKDITGIVATNIVKMVENGIERMGITSNLELDRFQDYIDEWVSELETPSQVQKFKTGYQTFDETILIENSNLILIASRPSLGKSAFALNLVKNFCKQKMKTLFVSLEMSQKEIMNRLVANMGGVKAQKVKRKEGLNSTDWYNIMRAKEEIKTFSLNTYAKGHMYVEQLVGLAKYLKKKDQLDILVVDYLQLLDSHRHNKSTHEQVSYISRKLKQIAMDLNIPVIALAQLNRASVTDGSKPREPYLADLRSSGSLEQDANIVVMLHSDDVNQEYQDERFIKLFVRKNRDGKLGKINYTYYGDYVNFVEKTFDRDTREWTETNYDVLGDI